ncbi:MAG: hypothetical protein ABI538_02545 [Pseudoxanthomonas sp.]
MAALRRFMAIMLADLRERTRSTRFWVVLALVGVATWWCFPALQTGKVAVGVDGTRGYYSSAWAGLSLGLMYSTLLAWLGFYLVRGTLVRDFDTRVWQLLVTTPMTRRGYLLAKWTSHMAVFTLVMVLGLVVGFVAQWVHAEDRTLDVVELLKPMLVLSMPALTLTAFFAVLFDMVPRLRRTGGNVLFFFVWLLLFSITGINMDPSHSEWARQTWLSDPSGMTLIQRNLQVQLAQIAPALDASSMSVGVSTMDDGAKLFAWTRWEVALRDIAGRLLWVLAAVIGILLLAPALDRAAARTSRQQVGANHAGRRLAWLDRLLNPLQRSALGLLLSAELRLVLRQRRWWWWLAIASAWAVQLFAPTKIAGIAAVVAWMISLDILARGILREREARTAALLFTAPQSINRLLLARTATALGITGSAVLPMLLRLIASAPATAAILLLVAANVALAGLAMGALCRSARPYELMMAMLAYAGIQGLGPLAVPAVEGTLLVGHLVALPLLAAILLLLWPPLNSSDWPRLPALRSMSRAGRLPGSA